MCKGIATDTLCAYKIVCGYKAIVSPLFCRLFEWVTTIFFSSAMNTKADDMCQTEVFESDKGVTFQIDKSDCYTQNY